MTCFRAIYKVCLVLTAVFTVSMTANARPEKHESKYIPEVGQLPTYTQLMSLSPTDRVAYLREIGNILAESEQLDKVIPYSLIAGGTTEALPARDFWDSFLTLVPEADAGFWGPDHDSVGDVHTVLKGGVLTVQRCDAVTTSGRNSINKTCSQWTTISQGDNVVQNSDGTFPHYVATDHRPNSNDSPSVTNAPPPAVAQNEPPRDPNKPAMDNKPCIGWGLGPCKTQPEQLAQSSDAERSDCKDQVNALQRFRGDIGARTCIYAGNMSQYANERDRKASSCKHPENKYCVDAQHCITCPKAAGQIVCNPLVFGSKDDKTALCVDASSSATTACNDAAKGGKAPYDYLSKFPGAIANKWQDFSKKFNDACAPNSDSAEAHCTECNILRDRLTALNTSPAWKNKLFQTNTVKRNEFLKDSIDSGVPSDNSTTTH